MTTVETRWERMLTRYFAAEGLPLKWQPKHRLFTGIAGHLVKRISAKAHDANPWPLMPQYIRKFEYDTRARVIVIVNNKRYGDSVEDSLVVMRLGTFTPMLKAMYLSDKERWQANESASSIW